MSPATFALQELSDTSLSESTGEGVALVLDNFKMVFQGANDSSAHSSYNLNVPVANPEQYDTGFIRIIPTGENYQGQYDAAINPSFIQYSNTNYQNTYTQTLNTITDAKRTELIAYEKSRASDSYWTERYYNYYNGIYDNWLTSEANRKAWSERDATNDVNRTSGTHYNAINTRVTNKINALENELKQNAEHWARAETEKNFIKNVLPSINTNISDKKIKADMFIYGLALSKSDGSLNTRFSNEGFNWGTPDNPWLFRAGTQDVKQFKDKQESVGYIAFEAPLALETRDGADNNIKLGFWSDIFARSYNSSNVVDPITGAPISGLNKTDRLRTQFVANGLSLNGSQVRMFQTLESDNPEYNKTLGLASLIRINTHHDPKNLTINDTDLDRRGIRISTATLDDLDTNFATPAMSRDAKAPIFQPKEGLYLYSPNINLVLGNMYQPFVVGSEGNNIILEITKIPNVPSIYNQIYQNYGVGLGGAEFKGSTCNVYQCGDSVVISNKNYQGNNATHSSIAIGTVERVPNTNLLRANDGQNVTGVVFKDANGISKNFGSAVIDGVLIQHLKFKTTGL
ncbi:hypothetical protein [Acinetobacter sp. LoGeW2-3]|uniref:hypothetical protein n=1 Tax=Acinetobacter sp. LoGeW2-3 TaxID=1808001 RepID=UPI001D1950FD|nr:hypothetical protein [Acinetobacter sp. LoGeW2-3]